MAHGNASDREFPDINFIHGELRQIGRLVEKGAVELDRGSLIRAHEALVSARQKYEALREELAGSSVTESEDLQVLALHLRQCEQAILQSERRLAIHVRGAD